MKVELDKTGMVHLVSGTYPSHDMQEALQNRNLGYRENLSLIHISEPTRH